MATKSNLEIVYETLKGENWDVPDSYDDFAETLTAPGVEGVNNRQLFYRGLRDGGWDVPDNYDDFAGTLFAPAKTSGSQTSSMGGSRDGVGSVRPAERQKTSASVPSTGVQTADTYDKSAVQGAATRGAGRDSAQLDSGGKTGANVQQDNIDPRKSVETLRDVQRVRDELRAEADSRRREREAFEAEMTDQYRRNAVGRWNAQLDEAAGRDWDDAEYRRELDSVDAGYLDKEYLPSDDFKVGEMLRRGGLVDQRQVRDNSDVAFGGQPVRVYDMDARDGAKNPYQARARVMRDPEDISLVEGKVDLRGSSAMPVDLPDVVVRSVSSDAARRRADELARLEPDADADDVSRLKRARRQLNDEIAEVDSRFEEWIDSLGPGADDVSEQDKMQMRGRIADEVEFERNMANLDSRMQANDRELRDVEQRVRSRVLRDYKGKDVDKLSLDGFVNAAVAEDPEYIALKQERYNLGEMKLRRERADKDSRHGGLYNFAAGVGGGLYDIVRNPLGVVDYTLDKRALLSIKDKVDSGGELSDAERHALESHFLRQQADSELEYGQGRKAGEFTAFLAEIAVEFGLNPASGLTRRTLARIAGEMGKSAVRQTLRRTPGLLSALGRNSAQVSAARFAGNLGRVAAAALGEGAAAAVTTQAFKNLGEYTNRVAAQPVIGDDGKVIGVAGESALQAGGKVLTSSSLTNAAFMFPASIASRYMERIGRWSRNLDLTGIGVPVSNPVDAFVKMKSGELASVISGDLWGRSELDPSIRDVLDAKSNGDLIVGLLASEFFMAGLKWSGAHFKGSVLGLNCDRQLYNLQKSAVDGAVVFKSGSESNPGSLDLWNQIVDMGLSMSESSIARVAEELSSSKFLSKEQKAAALDYLRNSARYRGAVARYEQWKTKHSDLTEDDFEELYEDNSQKSEQPAETRGDRLLAGDVVRDLNRDEVDMVRQQAYMSGSFDVSEADRRYDEAVGHLSEVIENPGELLDGLSLGEDASEKLTMVDRYEDLTPEQRAAAREVVLAEVARDGAVARAADEPELRRREVEREVSRITNSEGNVQPAVMKSDGREVYVLSGDLATTGEDSVVINSESSDHIVVFDPVDGKTKMVSADQIRSSEVVSTADREIERRLMEMEADGYDQPAATFDKPAAPQTATQGAELAGAAAGTPEAAQAAEGHPFDKGDSFSVAVMGKDQRSQHAIVIENKNGFVLLWSPFAISENSKRENLKSGFLTDVNISDIDSFAAKDEKGEYLDYESRIAKDETTPTTRFSDGAAPTSEREGGDSDRPAAQEAPEDSQQPIADTREYDRGYEQGLEEAAKKDDAWIDNLIKIYSQNTPESMSEAMKGKLDAYRYERQRRAMEAQSVPETVPSVENGQQTALSRIPIDEATQKPDFTAVDADTAWDALVEKTGDEQGAQAFAQMQTRRAEAVLAKAEKAKPKDTDDIDEFVASENERLGVIERARTVAEHWKKVAATLQRREAELRSQQEAEERRLADERAEAEKAEREAQQERERVEKADRIALANIDKRYREVYDQVKETPEAVEVLKNNEPQNIEEVAAEVLSMHKLLWNSKGASVGTKQETGYGNGERKKLFTMFASKEKGGKSLQYLAEDTMKEICDSLGIHYDNSEAMGALLSVLQQAYVPSDIKKFIHNRRIEQALKVHEDRLEAEHQMYDQRCREAYGMSAEDYDMYEEVRTEEMALAAKDFDEYEYNSRIADDIAAIEEEIALRNEVALEEVKKSDGNFDSSEYNSIIADELEKDKHGFGSIQESGAEGKGGRVGGGGEILPAQGFDKSAGAEANGGGSRVPSSDRVQGDGAQGGVSEDASRGGVEPTEAQKAAGNYKMVHRRVDGYNISIENAKGSVRRGKGEDGKQWQTVMQNDYGYIRGTEGVDGDHIDVFLSDTPEQGDVFVVDQVNEDGSFDEHKVMYGFPSVEAAREAYLSNYEPGWTGLGAITHVSKDEFKKWIGSSKRKTKPFADYKSVKPIEDNSIVGRSLSEQEATDLIAQMEANAEVAPATELTPENWIAQFGAEGTVDTPLGMVKMGANQLLKLYSLKRTGYFGMIYPTLNTPDVILEKHAPVDGAERDSKYIFVKTFIKSDGSRLVHFESVTVMRDGMEVSISSHEAEAKDIKKDMQKEKILHISEKLSPGSEWSLTEAPSKSEGPDLVPTSDNISDGNEREDGQLLILPSETSEEAGALSGPTFDSPSDGKDNALSADKQADGKEGSVLEGALAGFAEGIARGDAGIEDGLRKWFEKCTAEDLVGLDFEMLSRVADMAGLDSRQTRDFRAAIDRVTPRDLLAKVWELRRGRARGNGGAASGPKENGGKSEPRVMGGVKMTEEMERKVSELRRLLGSDDRHADDMTREPMPHSSGESRRIHALGVDFACDVIENGRTQFADFAKSMVELLGDAARPYLKSWYSGVRRMPEYDSVAFSSLEDVERFDVSNFDKPIYDLLEDAKMRVQEQEAQKAAARAETEIRDINKEKTELQESRAENTADVLIDEFCKRYDDFLTESEGLSTEEDELADMAMAEEIGRYREDLSAVLMEDGMSKEDAERVASEAVRRAISEVQLAHFSRERRRQERKMAYDQDVAASVEAYSAASAEKMSVGGGGSQSYETAGGEVLVFHGYGELPVLKQGEVAYVERKFSTTHEFNFDGSEHIESSADVAYLFRELEGYSVEHSFAVLVKDGERPVVMHLGMGSEVATVVSKTGIRAAYDAMGGADRVYFVHNHPTGNIRPSAQDASLLRLLREMLPEGVMQDGIIMDTRSGEYAVFGPSGEREVHKRAMDGDSESYPVYRFDKHVFLKDYDPTQDMFAFDDGAVARIVSSQRLGQRDKLNLLVLGNNLQIVGSFVLPAGDDMGELADESVRLTARFGGRRVVLFGNRLLSDGDFQRFRAEMDKRSGGEFNVLSSVIVENGLNSEPDPNGGKKTDSDIEATLEQGSDSAVQGSKAPDLIRGNSIKEREIDDFGEKLDGARKDILKDMARGLGDITESALVSQPLSQTFRRPNTKKLVEEGVLSADEALVVDAYSLSVLGTGKPIVGRSRASKRAGGQTNREQSEMEQWAKMQHSRINDMRAYLEADAEGRKAIEKQIEEQLEMQVEVNNVFGFKTTETRFSPVAAMLHVLKKAEALPGQKSTPVKTLVYRPDGGQFWRQRTGKSTYVVIGENRDEALDYLTASYMLKNGLDGAQLPRRLFDVKVKKYERIPQGRHEVLYLNGSSVVTKEFDTLEAAKEFCKRFKSSQDYRIREMTKTGAATEVCIRVVDPLSNVYLELPEVYGSIDEARGALDEKAEGLNSQAVDLIMKNHEIKRQNKKYFNVQHFPAHGDKKETWAVTAASGRFGEIISEHNSQAEAQAEADKRESELKALNDRRKKYDYFKPSQERIGEDYRGGADATPEMFGDEFGFRGVQFGNWTNQNDRQMALNQAYDALHDLAVAIGVPTRALSLNGELGLAFGARGSGSALAHYEPSTVVINLTKTRGAGSLAHEWWHALDNYFARHSSGKIGYATEGMTGGLRDQTAAAFRAISRAVSGSDYAKRSAARGAYWGSMRELTARLFAEWVDKESGKKGEHSPFLARGVDTQKLDRYKEVNWLIYQAQRSRDSRYGRKPEVLSREEFMRRPEALRDYVEVTPEELHELGGYVSNLFKLLEFESNDGNVALHEPSQLYEHDNVIGRKFIEREHRTDNGVEADTSDRPVGAEQGSAYLGGLDRRRRRGNVVSGYDLGKLSEGDQRAVAEYFKMLPSAPVVVVGDVEDVKKETGLSHETKEKICSIVRDNDSSAIYCRENKKIYIFANSNSDKVGRFTLQSVLVHENAHALADSLDGVDDVFLDRFAEAVRQLPSDFFRSLDDILLKCGYSRNELNDEIFAVTLQWMFQKAGAIDRLREKLDEESLKVFDEVLTELYGGEERYKETIIDGFRHKDAESGESLGRNEGRFGRHGADRTDDRSADYRRGDKRHEVVNRQQDGIEYRTPEEGIAYVNARDVQPWSGRLDDLRRMAGRGVSLSADERGSLRELAAQEKAWEEKWAAEHSDTDVPAGRRSRFDFYAGQYGQGGMAAAINSARNEIGPLYDAGGRLVSAKAMDMARRALPAVARRRADLLADRPSYSRAGQAAIDAELADLEYMALYYQRMEDGEDVARTMPGRLEHQRMLATAKDVAESLGEKVVLYEAPRDIEDSNYSRRLRKQRSFGWYNPNDGTVHINVGLHRNAREIVRTALHEIVGHKTIEQIMGPKRFARLIDEIWNHAGRKVRSRIEQKMHKHGWDFREATKEYLGELAEEVDAKGFEGLDSENKTIWQRVKAKVQDFLNRILDGLKIPARIRLTEKDLSYMMWKLYKHQQRKAAGKPAEGDIFDKAEDVVRREEWKKSEGSLEIAARVESISKRERIEKLRQIEPVVITGKEIKSAANIKDYKKNALEYGKSLQGEYVNADTGNLIQLQRGRKNGGINEILQHDYKDEEHLQSIAALPQIIERGIYIDSRPNNDLARNPDVTAYQHYVCGLKIGEEDYTVHSVVAIDNNGNRYYDHKLSHIEKGRLLDFIEAKQSPEQILAPTPGTKPTIRSERKIRELISILQIDDEAGVGKHSAFDPESGLHFRDGNDLQDMKIEEKVLKLTVELAERHGEDVSVRDAAVESLGKTLGNIRKAMAAQRSYDYNTVRSLGAVADVLISSGSFLPEGPGEVKRLYGIMKRGIGHSYTDKDGVEHVVQSEKDFNAAVEGLMDLFVSNQLKLSERFLNEVLKIRGSKVNARGVEVMGELDVEGQIMVRGMKDYMGMDLQSVRDRMDVLDDKIANGTDAVSMNAAAEKMGVELAEQYISEVSGREAQERLMRDELRDMPSHWDPTMSGEARKAYTELKKALRESIRKIRIERAEAMRQLASQIGNELRSSIERVNEFREREKQRIEEIWHNANSDMTGRVFDEHGMKNKGLGVKLSNNVVSRILLAPAATFEQIMRVFGKMSINGEGYLFDRYVRGWQECRDKEWTSTQEVEGRLDAKASKILGNRKARWSDLYSITSHQAGTCDWWDGGEMREHQVTQGNLMYMYMVDKMTDGRVKLRRMGISEDKMSEIEQALDPRLKDAADWLQVELLPELRNKYNEVHMRMFGAPMAEIENYFPLNILANARLEEVEMAGKIDGKDLPKTMTGAIIKRRFNNYALDLLNSDAVSVALDHIREMETWAAFAEYRRDLCTLLSYKHFRNQVKNMATIYGSGERFWNKFYDLSLLVGGAYQPKVSEFDKAAVNITKLATGACIAIRINTALKQFLSYPAFAPEANIFRLMYNMTPWRSRKCWEWAMENMPAFQRRWQSRQAGNEVLKDWKYDWDWTRSDFVQKLQRAGITPNAFIDALTVAMGSEAIYHSKFRGYVKDGFGRDVAHRRAVQDAEIIFNLSQQSSELPYLSLLQNDRSYLTTSITNFSNSPFSYTRQSIQSKRELINMAKSKDAQIEFETKKGVREGLTPEQAAARAKRKYKHNWARNVFKSATFDFILPALWTLGGSGVWYMIFGKDDEKKKQYAKDALKRSSFGPLEGLTFGGTIPDFLYGLATGDKPRLREETSPAMGLLTELANLYSNGKTERAANEMLNTLIALGVGVNPQVIEDAFVAGMDFFDQEEKSARDWALLFMRVISCPQSQMDQVYFDELGMSAAEASRMSPAELAERYATYKARRANFATMWLYDDERWESEVKESWRKRFEKEAKERLSSVSEKDVNERLKRYDSEYKDVGRQLRELKELDVDVAEKARRANEIYRDGGKLRRKMYQDLNGQLDKMIKGWLKSESARSACRDVEDIVRYKAFMADALDESAGSEKSRSAYRQARMIYGEWLRRRSGNQ